MTSDRFPYSFSDELASPDMAAEVLRYESPDNRFAREVAAEGKVKPSNPAYSMVRAAILRTLEHIRALGVDEQAMAQFEEEFQLGPPEPTPAPSQDVPTTL